MSVYMTCCCWLCNSQQPLKPAEADRVTNLVVSASTEMNEEWLDLFSSLTRETSPLQAGAEQLSASKHNITAHRLLINVYSQW